MLTEKEFETIIEENRIYPVYQPIISIKEKRVVGVEALTRGGNKSGGIITPDKLFNASQKYGKVLEFDRQCRKNAITKFGKDGNKDDLILFLNFDPAILNSVSVGSCWMEKLVIDNNIDTSSVAIEIVESKVDSEKTLIEFTNLYRDLGFLIVLDDFGAEHSNLNRVIDLKPDIIKIDKKIVNGVSNEHYKRAIISSIVNLSNKTGVLTLAEGVEKIKDITTCCELGVDLFQGFFFAKPDKNLSGIDHRYLDSIYDASEELSSYLNTNARKNGDITKSYIKICDYYISTLKGYSQSKIDDFFNSGNDFCDNVQCLYLLDSKGFQISGTNCHIRFEKNKLFSPSAKGADHSLKEYFYQMSNHRTDVYLTDPYISLATGNICRTMSRKFRTSKDEEVILCIDFI